MRNRSTASPCIPFFGPSKRRVSDPLLTVRIFPSPSYAMADVGVSFRACFLGIVFLHVFPRPYTECLREPCSIKHQTYPIRHRSEQWLMSLYEEDASPGAASGGEPLSISIALCGSDSSSQKEARTVRVGLVAVDVRTGKMVHDSFEESSGQRQELHTRLRHLRSASK